ncbi:hypothetical protein IJI31_05925 [bacterium]|nr:hypothetical protein [bacterium]
MSQFDQLKLYSDRLLNISDEIRRFLENGNYDEAITKSELKDKVFSEYYLIRNYINLSDKELAEVQAWEQRYAESEKHNIEYLQNTMKDVAGELKAVREHDKIFAKYQSEINQDSHIIDVKDSDDEV